MILNIKRLFGILALFSMLMLLMACKEGNYTVDADDMSTIETAVDLSNYPIGVQKGNVSIEYYELLIEYWDEAEKYGNKLTAIKDGVITLNGQQKEKMVQTSEDYLVYLNGINYEPTGKIEQEIDNYFKSVIRHQENMSTFHIKYYNGDTSYKSFVSHERDAMLEQSSILLKIMDKYELFVEE